MIKVVSDKYENKTSTAILILDKIYFTAKQNHCWYKEVHYLTLKGTVNLDEVILVCTWGHMLSIHEAKLTKL